MHVDQSVVRIGLLAGGASLGGIATQKALAGIIPVSDPLSRTAVDVGTFLLGAAIGALAVDLARKEVSKHI